MRTRRPIPVLQISYKLVFTPSFPNRFASRYPITMLRLRTEHQNHPRSHLLSQERSATGIDVRYVSSKILKSREKMRGKTTFRKNRFEPVPYSLTICLDIHSIP